MQIERLRKTITTNTTTQFMKKVILLFAALAFTVSVFAQKPDEIKPSDLPKNVTSWISQNFKKSTIERAGKATENKNVLGYIVSINSNGRKMILVFDKNGKYIDKVRKAEEAQALLKPSTTTTPPPKK
jgi:hypothetical protein